MATRIQKVRRANVGRKPGPGFPDSEQVAEYVRQHDKDVLYASGAYGRKPTVKDWEAGKDFRAINPPVWEGGQYFSVRDVERIYALGYTRIIFGGSEGFNVELVMQ